MFRTTAAAIAILALTAAPALAAESHSFAAKEVSLDGLLGTLQVTVDPAATQVSVNIDGPQRWLEEISVSLDGDRVEIVQDDRPNRVRMKDREDWLAVTMTVPAGTELSLIDYIGEGEIGDLAGALTVDDMQAGNLKVGRVTVLDLGISGSGDVTVASADTASIAISGSGDVDLGDVSRDLSVAISGSGDIQVGRTTGKVELAINGSGDVEVTEVNGPVSAGISGSGDVRFRGGVADPFNVSISGSGNVSMDGMARNQTINQSGSGSVRVANNDR